MISELALASGIFVRGTFTSKKLGNMITNLMARRNPKRQFLIYDWLPPDIAEKGIEENFSENGLANVHHVPVLDVDFHSVNYSRPKTGNLAASLGFPDILHTDNIRLINLPNVKIVFWVTDQMFIDDPDNYSNSESERCCGITNQVVSFADMVLVDTECEREKFLERYPEFPGNRIRALNLNAYFEDKAEEFTEKFFGVYEEIASIPKRSNVTAVEGVSEPITGPNNLIYRSQKETSLTNQCLSWVIRLVEKNATTKNRLKKVGFLKKLVKFARPRFARKFPDWV